MSSCFILNVAGIPVLMKIIFFSLPPRGVRYTDEAPGVVDVVGACQEQGAPGGEEPWGCGISTFPNARTVLLLSGCPHGCRSLLGDNPQLLLTTLQVKTLCLSACGTGPPRLADLKSFRCSWSPCSKPPFLLITESFKRSCFSRSPGYPHSHYVSTNSLELLIFPLPLPKCWDLDVPPYLALQQTLNVGFCLGNLLSPESLSYLAATLCQWTQQQSPHPHPHTRPGTAQEEHSRHLAPDVLAWGARSQQPGVSSRDDCKS